MSVNADFQNQIMKPPQQEIEDYILKTLEGLCRDWDYSRPVALDSLLFTELGLESLDAVILGTAIQEHFRKTLPFPALFAELGEMRRDLSIRELVAFVDKHLADASLASPPAGRPQ
jgi:acyl carrier protein